VLACYLYTLTAATTAADMSSLDDFSKGDPVAWNNGKVEGTVDKVITEDTKIKGFTAKASEEDPKLMVKSDKTGAKAAHKPESVEPLS
jgi:Hypervirulence associated proteins TUDOR domain